MTLVPFLGALAVLSAIVLLWWSVSGPRLQTAVAGRNLRASLAPAGDLRGVRLARPARTRVVDPAAGHVLALARRVTPAGRAESLRRRLLLAGSPAAWPLERVLVAKAMLGLVVAAGSLLWFVGSPGLGRLAVGGLATVGAYLLPDLLVSNAITKRKQAIQRALPDIIDQLTICVEAGVSLEAAMQRTAVTGNGPLHQELARTLQDVQAGMRRSDALAELAARTDVDDLDRFVLAATQAESYGLPIARVLRIQSSELRLKRRQRAEEAAMKLPVKIVFPVVLFIFPALFIVLLGPPALSIFEALG